MSISKYLHAEEILNIEHEQIREVVSAYRKEGCYSSAEQLIDYIGGIVETTNRILEEMQVTP